MAVEYEKNLGLNKLGLNKLVGSLNRAKRDDRLMEGEWWLEE